VPGGDERHGLAIVERNLALGKVEPIHHRPSMAEEVGVLRVVGLDARRELGHDRGVIQGRRAKFKHRDHPPKQRLIFAGR